MQLLNVSLLTPYEVIFRGKAKSIVLPGEEGVFEIASFHKPILSRLISGKMFIDQQIFSLKRGIVRVYQNNVTIIIEEV